MAVLTRPSAILFDLDETLLDGAGLYDSIVETCEEIAAQIQSVGAAELLEANSRVWAPYWQSVERDFAAGRIDAASIDLEAWSMTLKDCDVDDAALASHAAASQRRRYLSKLVTFADVEPALSAIKENGFETGIVTNGPSDIQRAKLNVLNLSESFNAIVVTGEHRVAKPSPEPFAIALEILATEPARVWHVGDSVSDDVAGAKAAGLTAVWLNRSERTLEPDRPEPDFEVANLLEVAHLSASLPAP